MKKQLKLLSIVLAVVGLFLLSSCGSNADKIVGAWNEENSNSDHGDLEFSSDHSVRQHAVYGTYEVNGKELTIHITSGLAGEFVDVYEVSFSGNDEMMLKDENGKETRYIRLADK